MDNQYIETAQTVQALIGHEYLYFDSALAIKKTPHSLPFIAWAVCVSPSNDLYIMDANQQWRKVEPTDTLIISSLYQRINILSKTRKIA